jgi:hypothetical protein
LCGLWKNAAPASTALAALKMGNATAEVLDNHIFPVFLTWPPATRGNHINALRPGWLHDRDVTGSRRGAQ